MVLNDSELDFAKACCLQTAGGMVNGIVHNLNNPLHALTMQVELFQNALSKQDLDAARPKLQDKCLRLQRIGQELKAHLEVLSWRDSYTSAQIELIDPGHYGTWFLQFWRGNLFFKHNISTTLAIEPPPPHVQTVPLAMTWGLEAPLRTLLQLWETESAQGGFLLHLEIGPHRDGIRIRMHVAPETKLENAGLSTPIEHEAKVRALTTRLGWEWQAGLDAGELTVVMALPGKSET